MPSSKNGQMKCHEILTIQFFTFYFYFTFYYFRSIMNKMKNISKQVTA